MASQFDERFYRGKSWGTIGIAEGWDLPNLKVRYLMEALCGRDRRDASLLEVGCGGGRMLRSVRERDADLQLTGLDASVEQIQSARREHAELAIDYRTGDGEHLPFENESFDFVTFLDYLEHIERPQRSVDEMARVLKPRGTMHFFCPAEGEFLTPYHLSHAIFGRHFKQQTLGHIQRFTMADIDVLVRRAGLWIVRRRYSYHLIGSSMDHVLYTMLLHPLIAETYWDHDKYHRVAEGQPPGSMAGAILNAAMTFGNAVAYFESSLLKDVRFFASAVHVTAIKPG